MLFNSLAFLCFFPVVVMAYWLLPNRFRNHMLLLASYYFYMNWKPAYALLILFSTITTWGCGLMITKRVKSRKTWLVVCLTANLGILFFYKYLNFATASIYGLLEMAGIKMDVPHFNLLLPVGISFYTFQAIGYTIDVYKKKISAEKNLLTYALFVSFFPQLVAGPIERAKNMLCQFHVRHTFEGSIVINGLRLMVWGYFMKLCVAENVAPYVDAVFNNLPNHNGTSILLASFFFTFQIFCDFGGYSLIAIGAAKCMGFTLMENFNHPYLSTSMRDFWRRWHISLSSWFTEYVYIPLGGNRCSAIMHIRNLMLTMLLSGLWHGANWTFIIWGGYHGILLVLYHLKKKYLNMNTPQFLSIIFCFCLAWLGWIFFRVNNISDLFLALRKILFENGALYMGEGKPMLAMSLLLIVLLMMKEIKDERKWKLSFMSHSNLYISAFGTSIMLVIILLCGSFNGGQFIYFQF